MKVLIALALIVCFAIPASAGEPLTPMSNEQIQLLRLTVAALTVQLMYVLAEVYDSEEISAALRARIEQALEVCLAIVEALGYTPRQLEGLRG